MPHLRSIRQRVAAFALVNMVQQKGPKSRFGSPRGRQISTADPVSAFSFVPQELIAKCRRLIESYHATRGAAALADTLWQCEARDFINRNGELKQIFKNSARIRSAKRAGELLLYLATIIVSLEVLARDVAGWGAQFPEARQRAENALGASAFKSRTWLMDTYVYPSSSENRVALGSLAPNWPSDERPDK